MSTRVDCRHSTVELEREQKWCASLHCNNCPWALRKILTPSNPLARPPLVLQSEADEKKDERKPYTMKQIEKHNSEKNGVWILIRGGVYDVTEFLEDHPGGPDLILDVAGKDATNDYEVRLHSPPLPVLPRVRPCRRAR